MNIITEHDYVLRFTAVDIGISIAVCARVLEEIVPISLTGVFEKSRHGLSNPCVGFFEKVSSRGTKTAQKSVDTLHEWGTRVTGPIEGPSESNQTASQYGVRLREMNFVDIIVYVFPDFKASTTRFWGTDDGYVDSHLAK